ncbi:MAG: IS66 family transposase zinc-finger binding domain-containing protein [Bacteroidetes bacterium]|nr:IS66 family transposase zinc-finger binding domain-containing protein [Bacteroidota bacterium]
MSKTPDKIVDCRPCACEDCGSSLRDTEGTVVDKRQQIDIPPIKLEITEYRLQSAICPNCQKGNLGKYPENITSNSQFGVNIRLECTINNNQTFSLWITYLTHSLPQQSFEII